MGQEYLNGFEWATRQVEKGRDLFEVMVYIESCFNAGIATDFHRGAREAIECIQ